MDWKLLMVVIACALVHTSRGHESVIEKEKGQSVVPQQKGIIELIASKIGETTKTTFQQVHDPPDDCPTCQCGKSRTSLRIVGGNETEVLEFPWMTALLLRGRLMCGASLINDYYVLTAAHCVDRDDVDSLSLRFLEHDLYNPNETNTIERNISKIIRHPKHNVFKDNDIALLKLNERVDLSKVQKRGRGSGDDDNVGLRPVCLPSPELSYANYNAVVTGWGKLAEGGSFPPTLQEVYVPIISNEDCQKDYADSVYPITNNMLCAGLPEGGKDACQGDSGGPLHIHNTDTQQFQEVGIVSWGAGCARPNRPGVYTRVNRYLTWIKENTKDACYCQ